MFKTALLSTTLLVTSTAFAGGLTPELKEKFSSQVKEIAQNPAVIAAVKSQNTVHAGLSQDDILALDKKWRAEVTAANQPTVEKVLKNSTSDELRRVKNARGGAITEIFVTDNKGLNVAASDVTSDYYQGDEAKFTEVFNKTADTVHFGDVEEDESTQTFQVQVSANVTENGQKIGTVTVGLSADELG